MCDELTRTEIEALPPCWYVEDTGWLIKGHKLTPETIKQAVMHQADEHVANPADEYDASPAELYKARELWVRKAQTYFSRGEGYAWEMQETKPHARGAGRFTLVDIELCAICPSPHRFQNHDQAVQNHERQ